MKRIILLMAAVMVAGAMQGQNVIIKKGNEGNRTDPQMVANGRYLATVDGLDCWLTQSEEGARGFVEDEDWQVVRLNDDMFPLERRELLMTEHCVPLAWAVKGKWASMLLVDSSQRKQTTVLKASVSLDSLQLKDGRVDTVTKFAYAKKDRCHVWGAMSANGEYMGTLSVVQYTERKQYISIATVYDAELKEVWSREFAVGTVECIYITDDGRMLTLGTEREGEEEHFIICVIDRLGGDKFNMTVQCEPVKDMRIVNVLGPQMLCAGLIKSADAKKDEDLTSGVATLSFNLDSMSIGGFTMRYFQNEDINILTNEKTKKIQRDRELPDVVPLSYVPTSYGFVMSVGRMVEEKDVNANGTKTCDYNGVGIHLVAVDATGAVKWVRNVRRNDRQTDSKALLRTPLFMMGETLCLVKNENRKEPGEYIISNDAREYEVGDKSNLVLYRFSEEGDVRKDVLERKTKQALGAAALRYDGTTLLITVKGSKTRKMEMTLQ